MLSKNKQGEWEVKIPSVRIFQGHPLLLCWVVYCAVCATHMKMTLQYVVCRSCSPPCKTKLC